MDFNISSLAPHRVGIDLAHVPPTVNLLYVGDVQLPFLVLPVGEGNPLVSCDDAVVDGEDSLCVHTHPSNLAKYFE